MPIEKVGDSGLFSQSACSNSLELGLMKVQTKVTTNCFRNLLALVCILASSKSAVGGPITEVYDLTDDGISFSGDLNSSGEVAEIPLAIAGDPLAGSITFNLRITLDWEAIGAASVDGLSGDFARRPGGIGANTDNTQLSTGDSSLTEKVFPSTGGEALERITFEITNLTSTMGSVVFNGFDIPTDTIDADYESIAMGGFSAIAIQDGSGFRIPEVTANFTTAVPEPSQRAMLVIVGLLLGGLQLRKKFANN